MKLINLTALALAVSLSQGVLADTPSNSSVTDAPAKVAHRSRHHHHHGDGWGPGWGGGGPFGRPHMCVARNARGMTFAARGWEPMGVLRRQALRRCRVNSFIPQSCHIVFCR